MVSARKPKVFPQKNSSSKALPNGMCGAGNTCIYFIVVVVVVIINEQSVKIDYNADRNSKQLKTGGYGEG